MNRLLLASVPVLALSSVALLGPASSVHAVNTGAAQGTTAGAASGAYTVDAVHSTVIFRIKHMNAGYSYGRFNDLAGTFLLDDARPEASSIAITVQTESIDTANEKRDQHLRSPDFFSAKEFPTITFKSTQVKKSGSAFEVVGDLTLHGVTKPVTATVEPSGTGKGRQGESLAGLEARFTIKRSDFGMTTYLPTALGDEVNLIVALEGARQ